MISIVTITFNNHEELVATIESLSEVTDKQVIVINGGSDQKTKDYLKSSAVVADFLNEADKGIADAFNKGALRAKGEFVTFLNSGDRYVGNDFYDRAQATLKANPNISFVHSDMYLEDRFAGKILLKPAQRDFASGQPYLFPTMVFRKDVFEKAGLFDLNYRIGMDFDFIVRMHLKGLRGQYLEGAPAVLMDGLGVSNKNEIKGIQEGYRSLQTHGLLNFNRKLSFQARFWRIRLKSSLEQIGFGSLITLFKKQKYRE